MPRSRSRRTGGPDGASGAGPIPTEFAYWKHIDSPRAKRMRSAMRRLFGDDPRLPDETVATWARGYYDADPVAESVVDELYLGRSQAEGRAMVDRALEQGVDAVPDAPESLRRLFAEVEQDPPWLDWEQVELGARVFRRYGTHMYSFAGAITLHGYRENSVAKPLAFTGAYTGESANRRFLETASFWIDVGEPGALRPGGQGRKTAMRVRLMHVFVRKKLLAHPDWDLEAWGVPISQSDALLTLMGGSFVPGYGLRLLGYRTSRDEILAMMHFWRYVGHLMGVQPRWYPETLAEAAGLMFASEIKSMQRSGDDGVQLSRSYLEAYRPGPDDRGLSRIAKALEYGLQKGYVGLFVPPGSRRHYGLPKPGPWLAAVLAQAPAVFARETARRRLPFIDDLVDARARRQAKQWVAARLGPRSAEYKAVEEFTR